MADAPIFHDGPQTGLKTASAASLHGRKSSLHSIRDLYDLLRRRRRLFFTIVGGLLLLCLAYCLIVPNQYEASSTVALRIQASSSLSLEAAESIAPASILSTPLQLETMVNVFHSERLAWRVIRSLKLYQSDGFVRNFAARFPQFDIEKPSPEAQGYLLDRFRKRLRARALPRTLLIEIRFRSKDPALAATVVNEVVAGYTEIESETRQNATRQASSWLTGQLATLTAQSEADERHLTDFERAHNLISTQQSLPDGSPVETLHDGAMSAIDDVGRQLVAATGDRILRESLFREAAQGDPAQVIEANPDLANSLAAEQSGASELSSSAVMRQVETQRSAGEVEMAQLSTEHGPNYPRVVELKRMVSDLDQQAKAENARLLEGFRRAAKTAADREQSLRRQLEGLTSEGLRQNDATMQYAVLRGRVTAGRELCARIERRVQESALSAGIHASTIQVVDSARIPYKPVTPDTPLYLAITLVAALWLALAAALLMDVLRPPSASLAVLLLLSFAASSSFAQAPTPNTSGLPSGVVRIPQDPAVSRKPDPREAPPIWNAATASTAQQQADLAPHSSSTAMALPIAAGDLLELSEFHMPEFRSTVRVAPDGFAQIPLIGSISLLGMSELQAARALEKALLDGGLLLHPQVTVLISSAAGQDVSVLGEVSRPGVYPYTVHHRLLDLISAASGLTANAGRLVTVFHRDDPHTGHPVVLEGASSLPTNPPVIAASAAATQSTGKSSADDHNPELAPGDTVEVSRAGLAYVIGDVVRPGGFAVDPVQGLTVVQALSLAWGATPNAAVGKAILIRNQTGGRTLTTLNLRRMIRGQDPDQPVRDRDILFIPDSTTKNLLNKSLESAIQSAIGVTIYAGLVYSQRF